MKHIQLCTSCGMFTMMPRCPSCAKTAITTWPPKYSVDDKYAALRRKAKAMVGV
jgi:rRNA maturation protein Nop10